MTQIMAYCCFNYSKMNICSFVIRYDTFVTVHLTFKLLKKIPLKIGSKTGKKLGGGTESLTPTGICAIALFNLNLTKMFNFHKAFFIIVLRTPSFIKTYLHTFTHILVGELERTITK